MTDPNAAAAATSSMWMDDWSDDEVLAIAISSATGGGIDEENMAFAKARNARMLDLGPMGWKVRDSAGVAANWQLKKRGKS